MRWVRDKRLVARHRPQRLKRQRVVGSLITALSSSHPGTIGIHPLASVWLRHSLLCLRARTENQHRAECTWDQPRISQRRGTHRFAPPMAGRTRAAPPPDDLKTPPTESQPRLVTTREVASLLRVSTKTIRRMVLAGALRSFVIGVGNRIRFKVSDIEQLLHPVQSPDTSGLLAFIELKSRGEKGRLTSPLPRRSS